MRKTIGISLTIAPGLTALIAVPVAAAPNLDCDGIYTEMVFNDVNVPRGATCELFGVTLEGDVTVKQGASLRTRMSSGGPPTVVHGDVRARGASELHIVTALVHGNVFAKHSGQVSLVDLRTSWGHSILGDVRADHNDRVKLEFANIKGSVRAKGNDALRIGELVDIGGDFSATKNRGFFVRRTDILGDCSASRNTFDGLTFGNTIGGAVVGQCPLLLVSP